MLKFIGQNEASSTIIDRFGVHDKPEEIEKVIDEFLKFIGNRKLVGYFLEFDIAMINKYLKPKLGIKLPNRAYEVSAIYHDWKIEKFRKAILI